MALPLQLAVISISIAFSHATYVLDQAYTHSNFFEEFTYFTGADPTNGFVEYVDQSVAASSGLANGQYGSIFMGVDSDNVYSINAQGRPSVRVESKATYTHGLFILDLNHMPVGCGVWPAYWTYGPDWPNNGEIDILEGVNLMTANKPALHTSVGCTISGANQTGILSQPDCSPAAPGNVGCGSIMSEADSYGAGLNAAGGGVYAMEWTSTAIQVWFWPRDSAPLSITSGSPDPDEWGTPSAYFGGDECDIDSKFSDQTIVFDITFCGAYAGGTFEANGCPMAVEGDGMGSCVAYVAGQPKGMKEAYWDINSLKVYQDVADDEVYYWSYKVETAAATSTQGGAPAPTQMFDGPTAVEGTDSLEELPAYEGRPAFERISLEELPAADNQPTGKSPEYSDDGDGSTVVHLDGLAGTVHFYADYHARPEVDNAQEGLDRWVIAPALSSSSETEGKGDKQYGDSGMILDEQIEEAAQREYETEAQDEDVDPRRRIGGKSAMGGIEDCDKDKAG